jgi:hypothetical protein
MPVERRERVIAIWLGSTGDGRNPMFNGRRQPSRDGTSRMTRECQVRICERLGVKFPGPTRQILPFPAVAANGNDAAPTLLTWDVWVVVTRTVPQSWIRHGHRNAKSAALTRRATLQRIG